MDLSRVSLGESVVVVVTPRDAATFDLGRLQALCRQHMPAYMVPAQIEVRDAALPRNANGKIDRKLISMEFRALAPEVAR